jgi:hypothetical protein
MNLFNLCEARTLARIDIDIWRTSEVHEEGIGMFGNLYRDTSNDLAFASLISNSDLTKYPSYTLSLESSDSGKKGTSQFNTTITTYETELEMAY